MFGLFAKRKANKSKMKLANQFEEIAGISSDGEIRQRVLQLRTNVLHQPYFPSNWRALDDELLVLLYQFRNQLDLQNISTANIYLEQIENLTRARAQREDYIVDEAEKSLLGLKVQMHEMVDDVKRLIYKNAIVVKKIERTPTGDPTFYMLDAEKKGLEAKYYDLSNMIKNLALLIAEKETGLKPEYIAFYKKLRGLQGDPKEIEDQMAEYLFDEQKFEENAVVVQEINESRFTDAGSIPSPATPAIPLPQDVQSQRKHEASKKPIDAPKAKKRQIEEV